MNIKTISAKEILDSKGDPTLEVEVILEDKTRASVKVPSGSSKGKFEACELRDSGGKGVSMAIANVQATLSGILTGKDAYNQRGIDELMIKADGTANKSRLGGNAITGVSMAVCRSAAISQNIPLYQWIGQLAGNNQFSLPQPMILMMEGGKHGAWATDIQEFLLIPRKDQFSSFVNLFNASEQVFLALGQILKDNNLMTTLGFEGGYCPRQLKNNQQVFELILSAIKRAGYLAGKQFVLGIDAASSEFFREGNYVLHSEAGRQCRPDYWLEILLSWLKYYPLWSLEDVFEQEAWPDWTKITALLGESKQIVGDDLLVTNIQRINKAIKFKACNSLLVKINQIGTITETLEAIKLAKTIGWQTIVSHRSGETMDDFIADFCVGAGCPQCKFGGPTKPERLAKYNRLIEIEKNLKFKRQNY
jgi:enolase